MTVIVTSSGSVTKAISTNPIKQGSITMNALPNGTAAKLEGELGGDDTLLNNKYNTRFNAPRYYSGDTAL
jgi:hypothetical protein